jgi:hypothetical protein
LLVPRLKAEREVCVILSPREEDIQDMEAVIVQRHLDEHLHGLLSIPGRSFVVGRKMPLSLTLMPLEKVTIQRLAIHLDGEFSSAQYVRLCGRH